jgi:hypothetical protein
MQQSICLVFSSHSNQSSVNVNASSFTHSVDINLKSRFCLVILSSSHSDLHPGFARVIDSGDKRASSLPHTKPIRRINDISKASSKDGPSFFYQPIRISIGKRFASIIPEIVLEENSMTIANCQRTCDRQQVNYASILNYLANFLASNIGSIFRMKILSLIVSNMTKKILIPTTYRYKVVSENAIVHKAHLATIVNKLTTLPEEKR